jgi:hypothetical protein
METDLRTNGGGKANEANHTIPLNVDEAVAKGKAAPVEHNIAWGCRGKGGTQLKLY